jgi:deoxyribodipyrimidine photo-lyase
VITLREFAAMLARKHRLQVQHKLIYELGWRAYFRDVVHHREESLTRSMHPGPMPEDAYTEQAPAALIEGRTGIAAIDCAVRALYKQGYLHNHARMWLASYWVHMRHASWQSGASWMLKHLLDGDIASNALSWQWVAGTFSKKPYLFNAENVARFAPESWWSPDTAIDQDYAALEAISRGETIPLHADQGHAIREPVCLKPSELDQALLKPYRIHKAIDYVAQACVQEKLNVDRSPWLMIHPWALRRSLPRTSTSHWHFLGFIPVDAAAITWSLKRWHWVLDLMSSICDDIVIGSIQDIDVLQERGVSLHTWRDIHLKSYWPLYVEQHHEEPLFPASDRFHRSFSSWWQSISRRYTKLDDLLSCAP